VGAQPKEVKMTLRILAAGAAFALFASPAWADCAADIEALDEAAVASETGAAPPETEMPATEHQEEVLSGEETGEEPPAETGAGDVEAASPHQRQVTREVTDDAAKAEASTLLDEARELAQAGDEEGCQAKVSEAEELLGVQ
jgi:hypothetical protein